MTEAQQAVERLLEKHGTLQKAAEACGSTAATLSRIRAGLNEPSEETLTRIGLTKTVIYSRGNGKKRS